MVLNRTTSRLIHNVAPELICFRKRKPTLILLYQCEKNILNLTFNDYFIQFPLPYFVIICSFLTHSEGENDFYFPWKPSLMLEFLEIFRCCRLVSDFNVDFRCLWFISWEWETWRVLSTKNIDNSDYFF